MKITALKDAFTPNKNHVIGSPAFTTGYGWSNSSIAEKFLEEGLSIIKSIVFSGKPTTIVEGTSSSEGGKY
tara:strand:- start:2779 stop:2991 length:213 start_codon:yes stop_codon:yes gene_type:complete